jgi:hypothetical protein
MLRPSMKSALGALVLLVCACGSPSPPPAEPAPHPAPKPAAAVAPSAAAASATPSSTPPPAADADSPAAQPKTPFSVRAFQPPYERSAQPGDGEWTPVAETGEVAGEPIAFRSTVHPHPYRKDVYVAVIAFDLQRSELVWVAGAKEPESSTVSKEKRKGLVPAKDHDRLAAAFNGGFMARHGKLGAMLDGETFLSPKEQACTIGIGKDGSVRVAPWEEMAEHVAELASYRQTPACLVHKGELHDTIDRDRKRWGLSAEGKFDIRRSALGVDESGRILLVGMGEWVEPREIALSMKTAGAESAAELDINWSYTRFNFYGKVAGRLQVTGTLIPKLVHTKNSYIGEVAARDFFYVRRKN